MSNTYFIIELESQVARWKGQSNYWCGEVYPSFVGEKDNWKVKLFATMEEAESDLALIKDSYRNPTTGEVKIIGPNPSVFHITEHHAEIIETAKETRKRFDRDESTIEE